MTSRITEPTVADVLYGALWRWRHKKKRVEGRIVELAWYSADDSWTVYLDGSEIAVSWKGLEHKAYDHWTTTPATVLVELTDSGVPVEVPAAVAA